MKKAYYHLPGLFEFYELYKRFLPLYKNHREYFYDWCDIGSIYGAPADCLWGGGRVGYGEDNPKEVLALVNEYGISARLTFSNSLLRPEHLMDRKCNRLCEMFERSVISETGLDSDLDLDSDKDESGNDIGLDLDIDLEKTADTHNGVIVHSDLLLEYLLEKYPGLYMVSSTTKVLTTFEELLAELNRDEFKYVVPDFRLNKAFDKLNALTQPQKNKIEFLCNECCSFGCTDRKSCYESVSRKSLGEDSDNHVCKAEGAADGYLFSKAMENPGFIGVDDICDSYLPMGFTNYKIEGRSLGSAIVLEMLIYYMVKPEYGIKVREEIYLDSMLDLF